MKSRNFKGGEYMFSWLFKNKEASDNDTLIKVLTSKGTSKIPVAITVGDIKKGIVIDEHGYTNEVVLFLRKNKKDR
jgi:hypothetical protein